MSAVHSSAASGGLSGIGYGPVRSLLLWGLALTGRVNRQVLALLGLKDVPLESIESAFAVELKELRMILCAGELELGQLALMARGYCQALMAMAAEQRDVRVLKAATQALARLPLWVRDPELDELERAARKETAKLRLLEAEVRREELLARRAAAGAVAVGAGHSSRPAPVPVAPAAVPESAWQPAPPPADLSPKVKSAAESTAKTAISGGDSAAQVKSSTPPAGRKKLPRALRKAAGTLSRR